MLSLFNRQERETYYSGSYFPVVPLLLILVHIDYGVSFNPGSLTSSVPQSAGVIH